MDDETVEPARRRPALWPIAATLLFPAALTVGYFVVMEYVSDERPYRAWDVVIGVGLIVASVGSLAFAGGIEWSRNRPGGVNGPCGGLGHVALWIATGLAYGLYVFLFLPPGRSCEYSQDNCMYELGVVPLALITLVHWIAMLGSAGWFLFTRFWTTDRRVRPGTHEEFPAGGSSAD